MKKIIYSFLIILIMASIIIILFIDNKNVSSTDNTVEVKAEVINIDDSNIVQSGISRIGNQGLTIKILEGSFRGKEVEAVNHLIGKLELDNYYQPGDKILAALLINDNEISSAKSIDLYRQGKLLLLFICFVLCLILFARFIGLKALLSFVASMFIIYKILIPGLLSGKHPLILSAIVLAVITAIIMLLISGFTKKAFIAFTGTMFGLLITIGVTLFFGAELGLYGMTSPFAETLLYNGYMELNMQHIFYAAIIIGASGAAMDIGMDIAASMEEIKIKKPDITVKELIQSGFNVGRSVIGTMTTTLLLAYSGGYLTLMMLFIAKNSSMARMINLKIVSAEIMRILIGSMGIVLVAPITAIIAGWLYCTDKSNDKMG